MMQDATDMMLAIERSTPRPGWALFKGTTCVLEHIADEEPSRTPDWLVRLGEALDTMGVRPAEITRFAVGLGPGSFSGTRASVAALQGLALPGRRPVLGVASAAAAAFVVLGERLAQGWRTPVAVIGDARRERLWCAVFELAAGRLVVRTDGACRPPAHDATDFLLTTWDGLLQALPAGAWVITPDREQLGARLAVALPAGCLADDARLPTAVDVARLLLADPRTARYEPLPIYLHPAVAVRASEPAAKPEPAPPGA